MAEYDGEIRIKASIDAQKLDKEIEKTSNKIERQTESLERQKIAVEKLKSQYDNLTKGVTKTKEETSLSKAIKKAKEQLETLQDKKLNFEVSRDFAIGTKNKAEFLEADKGLKKVSKDCDELNEKIKKMEEELKKIKLDPKNADSVKILGKQLDLAISKEERLNSEIEKTKAKLGELANQKIGNFNKKIDEAHKNIEKSANNPKAQPAVEKIGRNSKADETEKKFGRSRQSLQKFNAKIEETGKKGSSAFAKMGNAVANFGQRILSLASSALVFDVFHSALSELKQHLSNLIAQDSKLSSSLKEIKANLLTAFMPVWQAILPALQALGKALAWVTGQFAAFMSMIFGKSVTQSQNAAKSYLVNADALDKQAKEYKKVGKSAKKAAGELASFDKIEVLRQDKPDADGGSGAGAEPGGGVDLSGFKNDLQNLDPTPLNVITKKLKEIGICFKQGFDMGFVDKNFDEILKKLNKIGVVVKRIFNDPNVASSFNKALMSIVKTLGITVGAVASIGVTMGRLLVGGLEKFLTENEGRIKNSIVRMFDITTELSDFIGKFEIAFADIFQVFGGENAQRILSNVLSSLYIIFDSFFLTLYDLAVRSVKNMLQPFITYKDEIKEALDGALGAIADFTEGTKSMCQTMGDTFKEVYDEGIAPYIDKLGKIWEDTVGIIINAWNDHIKPVLNEMAKKWEETVGQKINPAIKKFGEFAKKYLQMATDVIGKFWDFIKPFVKWLTEHCFDMIGTQLKNIWDTVTDVIGHISDFLGGFFETLDGLVDMVVGLFEGDWDRAWNGAGKVVEGMVGMAKAAINILIDVINGLINTVMGAINSMIRALNKISFDVPDWLGGGHIGFNIPEIPKGWANIPKLAQGAVLDGGNPFLAWVNDQPRGQTNIETPLNTMVKAFKEAVAEIPFDSRPTNLNISGDMAGFFRFLHVELEKEKARVGQSFVRGDVWV